MISRIKTDKELVQEAASKLALATSDEFDHACADMVDALQYAQSIEWWKQFDREVERVPTPEDYAAAFKKASTAAKTDLAARGYAFRAPKNKEAV